MVLLTMPMPLNVEGVDWMSKELVRQNAERYFAAMRRFDPMSRLVPV